MLQKVKSTVNYTVNQLSQLGTVLPGSVVLREYEISTQLGSAGSGLFWKIYKGYKKTNKKDVSIFILEKRQIDMFPKQDKDIMIEGLRKGIAELTKLKHPSILTIDHVLEETRDSFIFVSEPVIGCVGNLIGLLTNVADDKKNYFSNYKLTDVEWKYGFIQISCGLSFIHTKAMMIHGDLCPHNILFNDIGDWKLFGFNYSIHAIKLPDNVLKWGDYHYVSNVHHYAQGNLDYMAPEFAIDGKAVPASDTYSLGMTLYALFHSGKAGISCRGVRASYPDKFKEMNKLMKERNAAFFDGLPFGFADSFQRLLAENPQYRITNEEFAMAMYSSDKRLSGLELLDTCYQWDDKRKSDYFKTLPKTISMWPQRVCVTRVFKILIKECENAVMAPCVLPTIFIIANMLTTEQFRQQLQPHLISLMEIQYPELIAHILIENLEMMYKQWSCDCNKLLTFTLRIITSNKVDLQQRISPEIPKCASYFNYQTMRQSIIPSIMQVAHSSPSTLVRVNCLLCIGKMVQHIDKFTLLDDVLPALSKLPSDDPAVVMCIIGLYKIALNTYKTLPKSLIAKDIIPFLMPLCVRKDLTTKQQQAASSLSLLLFNIMEAENKKNTDEEPDNEKNKNETDELFNLFNTDNKSNNVVNTSYGSGNTNTNNTKAAAAPINDLTSSLIEINLKEMNKEKSSSSSSPPNNELWKRPTVVHNFNKSNNGNSRNSKNGNPLTLSEINEFLN